MEDKQIEKLHTYLHEEMQKTIFIMKGIESMDPVKLLVFPHPAIRKFIEITSSRDDLLNIIVKLESNSNIEPKELHRIIHFLYEVFEAADDAYDVFLEIANDFKEDSNE